MKDSGQTVAQYTVIVTGVAMGLWAVAMVAWGSYLLMGDHLSFVVNDLGCRGFGAEVNTTPRGRALANANRSDPVLLTVPEVANLLHVTPGTIYRLVRRGAIPGAFRVMGSWRFSVEQLDRWTKTAEHGATLLQRRRS